MDTHSDEWLWHNRPISWIKKHTTGVKIKFAKELDYNFEFKCPESKMEFTVNTGHAAIWASVSFAGPHMSFFTWAENKRTRASTKSKRFSENAHIVWDHMLNEYRQQMLANHK